MDTNKIHKKKVLVDGHWVSELRKSIIDFVSSLTEKVKNKKVLDCGAGDWYFPRKIFKPICSYTAQDVFSHPLIDIVCKAEDLVKTVGKESYDVVLCFDVLEHVENPFNVANNLYEVIKPGGMLALTVPFFWHIHAHGEKNFYDYWRFTNYGLQKLFYKFNQLDIRPVGETLEPIGFQLLGYK